MQQFIVLLDHAPEFGLGTCLGFQKIGLLIPGLLHFPFLPDYLPGLVRHLFNSLVLPVTHIHNLLCTYNGRIGNLYLIPQDIQWIIRHLLYNGKGLFREVFPEKAVLLCIAVLLWRAMPSGVPVARLAAFMFSNVTIRIR